MFDYSNKIALVTGASGDIGRAIAISLAKQGAKVAITGRRSKVLDQICKQYPKAFTPLVRDLSQRDNVKTIVSDVENKLGPIDILINNAGIAEDQLAVRMNYEMWQKVMNVNLFAAFNLSKSVIKGMMKRRYGRIIQITSIVGHTGNPGQTNYAASKAGLAHIGTLSSPVVFNSSSTCLDIIASSGTVPVTALTIDAGDREPITLPANAPVIAVVSVAAVACRAVPACPTTC